MIIDDHTLIRESCSCMLNMQDNFEVIAVPEPGEHVIEIVRQKRPDIILLDINMGAYNGFDMIILLRKVSPLSKIIGLSMHSQPIYAKRMIKLGARGYLTKNSPATEIIRAINQVYKGETYLCNEIKDILSEKVMSNDSEEVSINILSERETQILKLLKDGKSSKGIAEDLNISSRTVEVHRHHILKKLKMKNTVSAISFYNHYVN
jgi:two-component system invasion response regulator UvrY